MKKNNTKFDNKITDFKQFMSKKLIVVLISVVILAFSAYFFIGKAIWSPNISISEESKEILIPKGTDFEGIVSILQKDSVLIHVGSFRRVASFMRYTDDNIRPGRYIIHDHWSNKELISKLRSGNQDAEQVVINNIRLISDLAGKASRYFESDSMTFLQYLSDPKTAESLGFNSDNFMTMFIPNTYEMFWTTTPEKFVTRMKKEYERFWDEQKSAKLKEKGLDTTEAYIIASIVEKESNYNPERPTIAGVYLNRLNAGEKLQADPTVVFATGDFSIQRVLYSHLSVDSPYNTYRYNGLPPGPICMPSIASLEAVINAADHDYMFFCAKADNSGIHVFAKDYAQHVKNAKAFADWMNSRNIK
jgi:UPF0755 protein